MFLAFALVLSLVGCAGITPPTPRELLTKPLGTESIKVGMLKGRVKELWGAPNQINPAEDTEGLKSAKEEWVYIGRYSSLPIDAGYLSKTKKLYFDGENLRKIVTVEE